MLSSNRPIVISDLFFSGSEIGRSVTGMGSVGVEEGGSNVF